jgi:hypothetical protein
MSKLSPVPQGREIILPNRASPPRGAQAGSKKKGKIPPVAGREKKRQTRVVSLFCYFTFYFSLPSGVRNYELGVVNCMLGISKKCFLCFLLIFRFAIAFVRQLQECAQQRQILR